MKAVPEEDSRGGLANTGPDEHAEGAENAGDPINLTVDECLKPEETMKRKDNDDVISGKKRIKSGDSAFGDMDDDIDQGRNFAITR